MLGHPHEQVTSETAKATGVTLTGQWMPCKGCSNPKANRHAVPKSPENRAGTHVRKPHSTDERAELWGKHYVIIFVDHYSRMKCVRFLQTKSNTMDALRSFIANAPRQETTSLA